jgi:cell division protease FtsH
MFHEHVAMPPVPRNLAATAAEYAIRSQLRHYLKRDGTRFAALIKITDADDRFVYEEAARRLLGHNEKYDFKGEITTLVTTSGGIGKRSATLVENLKAIEQAVIFHPASEEVSEEIRLFVDISLVVDPPTPRQFIAAARTMGMPLLPRHAERLAGAPLRNIRLAMLHPRPIHRVIDRLNPLPVSVARPEKSRPGPELMNLRGYGEARDWGLQLALDLNDWKTGRVRWEDVDRGLLLTGPPGVGKTMFAEALANTCGVPLLTASAGQWQAKGHLGNFLKAMRRFFADAQDSRPCIAFLDEFDSFGNRETRRDADHDDYKRQVVNALLECLDPSGGRAGVVVVGACNNIEEVDRALLRPGRLERVIEISPPDSDARLAILEQHLGNKLDGSLHEIILRTRGWTGAQLAKLARDARRLARARDEPVSLVDVQNALPVRRPFTESELFRIAVHEAGHAVLSILTEPGALVSLRIDGFAPEADVMTLGTANFHDTSASVPTAEYFDKLMMRLLAGMVAEDIVFGNHGTGAGGSARSDLAQCTNIATMLERSFGFGDTLATEGEVDPVSLQRYRFHDPALAKAVERRLVVAREETVRLLEPVRLALVAVANALIEEKELDASRVIALVGNVATCPSIHTS